MIGIQLKHSGCSRLFFLFLPHLIVILIFTAPSRTTAAAAEREQLTVELKNITVGISTETEKASMLIRYAQHNTGVPLPQLQIKKVTESVWHIKHTTWKDVFWQINTLAKRVDRITGGAFGVLSSESSLVEDVTVIPVFGSIGNTPRFIELMPVICSLLYIPSQNTFDLSISGDIVSTIANWEVFKANAGNYHFRMRNASDAHPFWRIDLDRHTVFGVGRGSFGSLDAVGEPLGWEVHATGFKTAGKGPTSKTAASPGVAPSATAKPVSVPENNDTKIFQQDGKYYIRLSSSIGPLATYRITPGTGGGWKLSYVAEKHEGEIQ